MLFIHSLGILHVLNRNLAAGVPGRAVWLPPGCVSLACSLHQTGGLRERGELAEPLRFIVMG